MGSFPETKIIDPNFLPRETSAVQKFCPDDVKSVQNMVRSSDWSM